MKKVLILLCSLLVMLTGCKKNNKDVEKNKDSKITSAEKCKDISQKTFMITFNVSGGKEIETIKYPSDVNTLPSAVKDGYVFLGWYYDDIFTNKVESADISELKVEEIKDKNNCITGYKDLVLYAKWEEEKKETVKETPKTNNERVYYCDSGYTLSGGQCSRTEVISASVIESCPDGYKSEGKGMCLSLSGRVSLDMLHCEEGGVGPNSDGWCLTDPNDIAQSDCRNGYYWYNGTCYTHSTSAWCSDGSHVNMHGDINGLSFYCDFEGIVRYVHATYTYSCPAGYTLSGSQCSRTITVAAKVR